MKKILIIFLLIILAISGKTQNIQVFYKEQMKVPSDIEGVDDPQMMEALKEQLSNFGKTMTLTYVNGESVYKEYLLDTQDDREDFFSNSNVIYEYAKGTGEIYKNHKTKQIISQEYILNKSFLITDPLLSYNWKITREEKMVGDFKCIKAISGDTIAWYCQEVPIPDGPLRCYGLPGLIMEIENESDIITMKSIDLSYISNDPIVPPKVGKKISREKFEKILDGKMKNEDISDDNTVKFKIIGQ